MSEESTTVQVAAWLRAAVEGHRDAHEALVVLATGRLRRLASWMLAGYPAVASLEETADVLQESSMRLAQALRRHLPATPREFFVFATGKLRDTLRDLARHHGALKRPKFSPIDLAGEVAEAVEPGDSTSDPAKLSLWSEFHEQVAKLPANELEVFELLWYQGLEQQESADLLGISLSQLKRLWVSARHRLARDLGGRLPF